MKADQVKTALGGVVPDDRLCIEATHNAQVFSGSPEEFAKVSKILAQLDVPPKQVMFEAELVEMDKSKGSTARKLPPGLQVGLWIIKPAGGCAFSRGWQGRQRWFYLVNVYNV